MILTVVAVVVNDMSVVGVRSTMNVETLATNVSDVFDLSSEPFALLSVVSFILSNDSSSVDLVLLTSLVGNHIVSLLVTSDGSSS